ncbi:RING-H2 finger protein ATL68 [Cardamine amara subsp. amara]|uniref:RING-H2 finger protein ATL68 n=1 Tax=Cardamine amara subsp. amara TaxID=228776 RepID=A0ABD0ZYD4_CARAN
MDNESIKLEVDVTAWYDAPWSGVIISRSREIEELIIDENDDSITSLGSYPDSSSPRDPPIYLKLENFRPEHVYQVVRSLIHDHVMSEHISDHIVAKAQRLTNRQSIQEPLFMRVCVKLTQKKYMVVPYSCKSTTDSDQETTCAICLEDLSEDKLQIPNCSHWFHENCLIEWLKRNDSCPLCRQHTN